MECKYVLQIKLIEIENSIKIYSGDSHREHSEHTPYAPQNVLLTINNLKWNFNYARNE